MKKLIFILILISQICFFSFAADTGSSIGDNLTANVFMNFMFFEEISDPGASILLSLLTSTFSAGIGYHFNIVPHLFSPGIYGEGGIGLLTLLLSNDNDDISTSSFFGFLGIRLYNQFRFGIFDIQPFFGLNMVGGFSNSSSASIGFFDFGVLAAISKFGIEYGCYIPLTENGRHYIGIMHRVSFGFHIK